MSSNQQHIVERPSRTHRNLESAIAVGAAMAGLIALKALVRRKTDPQIPLPTDARRPPWSRLLAENLGAMRLIAAQLRPAPIRDRSIGAGRAVLIIPGFLTNDIPTLFLRRTLKALGFRPYGWANGLNLGFRTDLFQRLGARLDEIVDETGGPVALVGWSLGGLYARELAKRRPDDISLVVTLGAPFSVDVRANNAWWLYEAINDHPLDRPPVPVQFDAKPPVHTVAIWGLHDGVVAPASASGKPWESDEQIAVNSTHNELVTNAHAVETLIDVLQTRADKARAATLERANAASIDEVAR